MAFLRSSYRAASDLADAFRPGRHSHNVRRVKEKRGQSRVPFRRLKLLLAVLGLACLGFYGYNLADRYIYQSFENWAFDQQISGRSAVQFTDYLREATPFGGLFHWRDATVPPKENATESKAGAIHLAEGDLVGRISIGRLSLSAIVREGVTTKTLNNSVGHIPSTALPGGEGNFAIAAHRDTLFRSLKDIRTGDRVTVQSPAETYTYEIVATKIVKPSDVSVLRSDGGGIYQAAENAPKPARLLTMITCYPFYYVGSAPKRFIVEGRLISSSLTP